MSTMNVMPRINVKNALRQKYQLPIDAYLCGSFQRDTEGKGIEFGNYCPKLEKGPDLLADYFENLIKIQPSLHVVLAGWRRQYIIERLERARIPYTYFEKPSQVHINELYQTLDLYPVTARYEGGPQSLIECGLLNIPVVSTPIGMAERTLKDSAINSDVYCAVPCIPIVEDLKLPQGFESYREILQSL